MENNYLIIGIPRSGTTSLMRSISSAYNLPFIYEPFRFKTTIKDVKNVVIKTQLHQIDNLTYSGIITEEHLKKCILFYLEFSKQFNNIILINNDCMIELNKLINTFDENIICSSFCCKFHHGNPHNYIRLIEENYYERDTLNGLGVCFPKKLINDFNIETNKHFDEFLCKELKNKYNMRCICTSTSYIQHIGLYGVHSNPSTCDISDNFLGE